MTHASEKVCTKCKQLKPLSEYPKNSRVKSGYACDCKVCRRLLKNKEYQANLEKNRAKSRRMYYQSLIRKNEGTNFSTKSLEEAIARSERWLSRRSKKRRESWIRQKQWKKSNPDYTPTMERRERYLQHLFGIGLAQYNQMVLQQGGRCSICQTTKPGFPSWPIDHNHVTNQIRGLLCRRCNVGLGFLETEKGAWLARAETYLKNPPAYGI